MKNTLLFSLTFFLHVSYAYSQNLVPNFSFEQADSCPTNINNRTYKYSLGCVGWGQATEGTADYFNACDTAAVSIGIQYPYVGVPNNVRGYQIAYEGVSYVGIYMYYEPSDYKEYLITTIPALEIDTAYKVTIEVSLANYCEYATDAMGVLFTTYGSPDTSTYGTLVVTPQIDYTGYGIISDTIHWTTLTGIFIADSAYTSLIIGGFKNPSNMHTIAFNDSPSNPNNFSYYYIDNVVVEKLSSTGIAAINNNNNDVNIYPNPASTSITIKSTNHLINTIRIINLFGQTIYSQLYNANDVQVDVSGLHPGIYFVKANENTYKKFIKE